MPLSPNVESVEPGPNDKGIDLEVIPVRRAPELTGTHKHGAPLTSSPSTKMNTTEESVFWEMCFNCQLIWIEIFLDPRKSVDIVEVYLIMAAVFMIVLAIGTPRRRQSRSIIIRYGVEGLFILSFPLISYTLGLMQGQRVKGELYPVWVMFIAMLFGGTNAMSVQKLDENKQPMKLYCDALLFGVYVSTVLGSVVALAKIKYISYIVIAMGSLLAMKNVEQFFAAYLASKPSSENGIKELAKYMKHEHQRSPSYDPCTMQGYKYRVLVHAGSTKPGETAITLEKIWCVFSSSNSGPISRLKDVCLSFALFHLVVRRYFGYTCPESKLDKTRDLVLNGLLRTEQDYGRAFQVIEVELAFLHDFFFTRYAYIMYGKVVRRCALSIAATLGIIGVGTWSLSVLGHVSIMDDLLVKASTLDVVVTKIVLCVLSVYELLQIWFYCASDWAAVSLVCKYVTSPSWQGDARVEKLLSLLGRPHRLLRYWRDNIGQYSVIDSFSYSKWTDRLQQRLLERFGRRKEGYPVELSMEVKSAIAHSIKHSISCRLSHGASSLMRHGMSDEVSWACHLTDEFTLTHSILVWHIATSYCQISETVSPYENDVHPNQAVATSLSNYCAYLVAFVPMFLPASPVEIERILDELLEEAKGALQNLVSPTEKYEKLTGLNHEAEAPSAQVLAMGVMLGKALERMENRTARWDLLADFWAEMLVYIAPSDNVADHIEHLAQGGEFVTHIWALLMHAGILERPAAPAATSTAIP